jgi:hypothetical protein
MPHNQQAEGGYVSRKEVDLKIESMPVVQILMLQRVSRGDISGF